MRCRIDRRRALALLAVFVTASVVFADQRTDGPIQPAVKVGYVPLFPQSVESESVPTGTGLDGLKDVLRRIQQPLAAAGIPTAFEVAQGNDYQVLTWLRTGELDAALVSPFVAYLLRRDGDAEPILEVCEASRCEEAGGRTSANYTGRLARLRQRSRVHATVRAGRGQSMLADPRREYDTCLETLWNESVRQGDKSHTHASAVRVDSACEIWMVSHLSSPGFAAPLAYTQQWVTRHSTKTKADDTQIGYFWNHFFSAIRFRMHQRSAASPTRADGRLRIWFSDSREAGGQTYEFAAAGESSEIPNHVLVVRPALLTRFTSSNTTLAPRRVGEWLLRAQGATAPSGAPVDRQLVLRPLNHGAHEEFARALATVFSRGSTSSPTLRQIVDRWFVEGRFDFTVSEVLDLLRHDQENSGSNKLSLVLPGGGVKSLYQAALLDSLYASGGLRNMAHGQTAQRKGAANVLEHGGGLVAASPSGQYRSRASCGDATTVAQRDSLDRPFNRPLIVQNVIGTSGGALVGLLAALRSTPETHLTDSVCEAARKSVFPYVDVLRVLSVLVLLAMFTIATEVFAGYVKRGARTPRTPRRTILPLLTALVAGTLFTATRADIGDASGIVAMFAAGTLLLVHFVYTCSVPTHDRDLPGSPAHQANIRLLLTMAVSCGGLAIWGEVTGAAPSATEYGVGPPAVLAAAASVSIALAVVFVIAGGAFRLKLAGVREYWTAIAVLAAYVTAVYLVLTGLAYLEWSTLLEMTRDFWIALLVVGTLFALVFVAAGVLIGPRAQARGSNSAADRVLRSYHKGVVFLAEHRDSSVLPSAALSLLWFATVGVTWWLVTIAPALYGQRVAFATFSSSVGQFVAAGHHELTANLIVTGALVEDAECGEERDRLRAGDMYFCFASAGENCGRSIGQRWVAIDAHAVDVNMLVDAAFASGSPFPIFPPKRVGVTNNCTVDLIDGGYAHNVPLEAAFLGGTRQVLVINSTPDDAASTETAPSIFPFGRLIRYAGRLLPFMFERAQQVDRDVQRHMLVASLTPSREHGEFPFLVDFRAHQQERLLEAVACDLGQDRRIGRVDRWGLPAVLASLPASESHDRRDGSGGLP